MATELPGPPVPIARDDLSHDDSISADRTVAAGNDARGRAAHA